MQCHLCKADIPADANFCPTCGAHQPTAVTGPTQRLAQSRPSLYAPRMDDGICPKCGASKVYINQKGLVDAGPGAHTVLNLHDIWHGDKAKISTYLCAMCGYIELYLADTDKLPQIIEKWERVQPRNAR